MLKRTVALGIGAASASGARPAAGNETLKTIHSLRTIHGNFTNTPLSISLWTRNGANHKHYLDWFFKVWHDTRPLQQETQMFKLLKRSGYIDIKKA